MLESTPTKKGDNPNSSLPIIGIIEVNGKPQILKMTVIIKMRFKT